MYCSRIASVFKHILLTCKNFNSSDDALSVRVKRQKFYKKHGLVDWICI